MLLHLLTVNTLFSVQSSEVSTHTLRRSSKNEEVDPALPAAVVLIYFNVQTRTHIYTHTHTHRLSI